MAKQGLVTIIELDLDDGFSEQTLNQLKKGVVAIQRGDKFLIEEYNNGWGYLIRKSGKEIASVEFRIYELELEKGKYKLEETEVRVTDEKEYAEKLRAAGII